MPKNPDDRSPTVFISHASKDVRLARQLAEGLRGEGFETFIDEDAIPAGANWSRKVGEALEAADFVVAVLSKNFGGSSHALREWEFAIGSRKHKHRVLAVLAPGTPDAAVPWIAHHIEHVKAGPDWNRTGQDVAKALSVLASSGGDD